MMANAQQTARSREAWNRLRSCCGRYKPALVKDNGDFLLAWFYGIYGGMFNAYALEIMNGIEWLSVVGAASDGEMTLIGFRMTDEGNG